MKRSWSALISFAWLTLVVAVGILAPLIADGSPFQPIAVPLSSPGQHPPLGTDALGRDVWARMVYGSRLSPATAILATLITVAVGGLAGLVADTLGGMAERVILWLANAALAVPGLLLAMLLVAGLGPGLPTVILAVGFGGAPGFARLSRTLFQQVHQQGYVDAAVALGANKRWIALRHLLPNARGQLISLATTHYAWSFLGTTTLTFLGLAGDPSIPEWGAMLNTGRAHLVDAPWLALWPGVVISLTILAVHSLGGWLARTERKPHGILKTGQKGPRPQA
jgi:peptide/nickel transport system permease protein